tara:strand:+ start:356 stop:613 length:258 start_codon:yes stop_codon:yes gene_type:complete
MKQFTIVYHAEYGKGHVVGSTPKGRDEVLMVWFPKAKEHDWVLLSSLVKNSDPIMSLKPITEPTENVSNELQDAITSMFFGGQPQ